MASIRWEIAQFFERRWWGNYLKGKEPKEYFSWKQNYWLNFLAEISEWVKPAQNHTFLDMGCGPAGIFMVLPGDVTAVDPLVNQYKSKLPFFVPEKFANVNFHASSAEGFKCQTQFDFVFSLNVINHVSDIRLAVKTLYSCCKPGGKLVLSIDSHNYKLLRTVFRYLQFDILHPHQLTLNEYITLLEETGFTITGEKCLKKGFVFDYVVLVAEKL
jgi:2-polyprenyl-6-hydroxyphenyl methylase/3-demethylubiquinone-9 3-methyltransferase